MAKKLRIYKIKKFIQKHKIILIAYTLLILFGLFHWYKDSIPSSYFFWKIDGYKSSGEISLKDSSLRIHKNFKCIGLKQLAGEKPSTEIIYAYTNNKGELVDYCGCGAWSETEKLQYKLFNNKIIYKCWNAVYETPDIPEKLKNNQS